jgi:hypothetical protein
MSDQLERIKAAVQAYLEEDAQARNELREMAEEAEEDDDYYDYDQACYDTWESMWGRGKSLADELAEILKEAR